MSTFLAATLALLDLIDIWNPEFEITGSFPTQFRIHINDGRFNSSIAGFSGQFSLVDI